MLLWCDSDCACTSFTLAKLSNFIDWQLQLLAQICNRPGRVRFCDCSHKSETRPVKLAVWTQWMLLNHCSESSDKVDNGSSNVWPFEQLAQPPHTSVRQKSRLIHLVTVHCCAIQCPLAKSNLKVFVHAGLILQWQLLLRPPCSFSSFSKSSSPSSYLLTRGKNLKNTSTSSIRITSLGTKMFMTAAVTEQV